MKRIRAIICLLLLALLCAPGLAESVEGSPYLSIETAFVQGQAIQMVLHSNRLSNVRAADIKVSIGQAEASPMELSRIDETAFPTCYVFLLDASSTMKESNVQKEVAIARQLVDNMKRADQAVIAVCGEALSQQAFTNDRAALNASLDGVSRKKEKTDLYQSVEQAVSFLQVRNQPGSAACLVILSNGIDSGTTSITQEEVVSRIANADFPVHTVSFVSNSERASDLKAARSLSAFARASKGGLDQAIGLDQTSVEKAALALLAKGNETYLLTCRLPSLSGDETRIIASYRSETEQLQAEKTVLLASSLPEVTPTPAPVPPPTNEPGPGPDPKPEPAPSLQALIWLAAVLCLLLGLGLLLLKKKKLKHSGPQESVSKKTVDEPLQEPLSGEETPPETLHTQDVPEEPALVNETDLPLLPQEPPKPKIRLVLTEVDHNGERYEFTVSTCLRIGRDAEQNELCLRANPLLSARHCQIELRQGQPWLVDLGSTNGTQLNGIPLHEPVRLSLDDVIRVGRISLRVYWTCVQ